MCINKNRIKVISIYFFYLAIFQIDTLVNCENANAFRLSYNSGKFVDLRESECLSYLFSCEFPTNIVNNTEKVFAAVHGVTKVPLLLGVDKMMKSTSGELCS